MGIHETQQAITRGQEALHESVVPVEKHAQLADMAAEKLREADTALTTAATGIRDAIALLKMARRPHDTVVEGLNAAAKSFYDAGARFSVSEDVRQLPAEVRRWRGAMDAIHTNDGLVIDMLGSVLNQVVEADFTITNVAINRLEGISARLGEHEGEIEEMNTVVDAWKNGL